MGRMNAARVAARRSILAATIVVTPNLFAQTVIPESYVFTSFGMEQGLSQGSVEALIQDRTGYLWIGTHDGLNRFDGIRFKTYKHDPADSTSLSDDFVHAVAETGDGRLWVGTERGGLNRFDPTTGRSERFELYELGPWRMDAGPGPAKGRPGRTIREIAPLPGGAVLLLTDLGLFHYQPSSGAARPVSGLPATDQNGRLCPLDDRGALVTTPDGSIWRIDGGARTPGRIASFPASIKALRCQGNRSYVVTTDRLIYLLDLARGRFEPLGRVGGDEAAGTIEAYDLLPDAAERLWLATPQGLHRLDPGDEVSRYAGGWGERGVADPEVLNLLIDATGVLWAGTWNGLSALHPLSLTVRRVLNASTDAPGLAGTGVISIQERPDGALWIGTGVGGVQLLQRRDDALLLSRPPQLAALSSARVYDLALSPEGTLWIAALDGGLYRLDSEGSAARPVLVRSRDGRRERGSIPSVFVDHAGDVWAGSIEHGLLRYDEALGGMVPFNGPNGAWDLSSVYVWPLVEDREGNLWVGAYNGGLSRIAADRTTQHRYDAGRGGLSDERILTLFVDSRGLVWIGTEGGGLNRLDPTTGLFEHFTVANGLPHDHVEGVTEDGSGHLWISTNDGLARFDPATRSFRVFHEAEGLAGNRFFANAAHRTDDGRLFFGGPNGLTILDPSAMVGKVRSPALAIGGLRIHGREAPVARALAPAGLELEPGERFFAVEYAALDFGNPTQNRYRYRLEGLDDEWVDGGSEGIATYTSVPPARYTLRVAATNSDGARAELQLPIVVKPYFWETGWFKALAMLAVASIITGFYLYRWHEFEKRQELRFQIAGRLHDDIAANLSTIVLKSELLRAPAASAESRSSHADDVERLAREAALKVRETVWVVNTRYDSLQGLISKIRDTTDLMLEDYVAYTFDAPPEEIDRPIRMELRQDLYLAFKESLQNILKHAGASRVDITLTYDRGRLAMRIHDDGRGFHPAAMTPGSGMGLLHGRMSRHGGRAAITSVPGEGTTTLFEATLS